MKFDFVSDVHTDLWSGGPSSINWRSLRNEGSDVLVLGGDTSNYLHEVIEVLQVTSTIYKHIVIVDGNHEHYFWEGTVDTLEQEMKNVSLNFNNVTYLDGTNYLKIENTVFIGCNGWYDFRVSEPRYSRATSVEAWRKESNDPRMINFGGIAPNIRADQHANLICKLVTHFQTQPVDIVAITHTIPSKILAQWSKYTNTPLSILDGAYYNVGMDDVIAADVNQRIKLWLYGHTHQRSDRQIGHVRFVNNARGYQCELNEMGRWFIVQLDTGERGYE